jgi:hypothetical protein
MIRPITVICWILALGAGLYLYRAKHEVELMDKHIEVLAKETTDIRADSRRLLDDWIRLGEPVQLQKYSDQYLGLKAISPPQFVRMTDLSNRLPSPRAEPVEPPAEAVAQSSVPLSPADASALQHLTDQGQQTASSSGEVDDEDGEDLPIPPIPPGAPVLTAVSLQNVTGASSQAKLVAQRAAAVPIDPNARQHAMGETRTADDPRAGAEKPLPGPLADPHVTNPGGTGGGGTGGQPARQLPQPRELSFSQAPAQGLPPPQGQGPVRPTERTVADYRANDQRREISFAPNGAATGPAGASAGNPAWGPASSRAQGLSPLQAQATARPQERPFADGRINDPQRASAADPRPPMGQVARQPAPMAPPAGSLLGMSRGPVPLPLPAPMPVSATWTGPGH